MSSSDEEFARRLQAEENGQFFSRSSSNFGPTIRIVNTANLNRGGGDNTENRSNPTVLNARLNDVNSSRATICVLFTVNVPQIIATFVILWMHYRKE